MALRLLNTVKAALNPSARHGETVCVGALSVDRGRRSWIRSYPIHFPDLRTGDLGRLDDEGFLFLTGRLKRIGKVFGVRFSLGDVERALAAHGPVRGDDKPHAFLEGADAGATRSVRSELADFLEALV